LRVEFTGTYGDFLFSCSNLSLPSCRGARRRPEGRDTARLPKRRQGKSRGRGRVRTTELPSLTRSRDSSFLHSQITPYNCDSSDIDCRCRQVSVATSHALTPTYTQTCLHIGKPSTVSTQTCARARSRTTTTLHNPTELWNTCSSYTAEKTRSGRQDFHQETLTNDNTTYPINPSRERIPDIVLKLCRRKQIRRKGRPSYAPMMSLGLVTKRLQANCQARRTNQQPLGQPPVSEIGRGRSATKIHVQRTARTDCPVRLTSELAVISARLSVLTTSNIFKSIFKSPHPVYRATFNVRALKQDNKLLLLSHWTRLTMMRDVYQKRIQNKTAAAELIVPTDGMCDTVNFNFSDVFSFPLEWIAEGLDAQVSRLSASDIHSAGRIGLNSVSEDNRKRVLQLRADRSYLYATWCPSTEHKPRIQIDQVAINYRWYGSPTDGRSL
ncbi:LOW QUALITY PROTEIN: hypothetical protein T265_13223, partial [Opisthorchis viverrini]